VQGHRHDGGQGSEWSGLRDQDSRGPAKSGFNSVSGTRVLSSGCFSVAYSLVAGSLPSHLEVVGFDVKDCRDLG